MARKAKPFEGKETAAEERAEIAEMRKGGRKMKRHKGRKSKRSMRR